MANEFDKEDMIDSEDAFVTLELEDGSEIDCDIVMIFSVEEQDYIALVQREEEEKEEAEVLFYRYSEDEEGTPSLDNIETDEEFETVADVFDQLLDEEDFEEM